MAINKKGSKTVQQDRIIDERYSKAAEFKLRYKCGMEQAMLACKFLECEASNRSLQQRVRQIMSKIKDLPRFRNLCQQQ